MSRRLVPGAVAAALSAVLAVSACGSDEQTPTRGADSSRPHGYVEGAEEVSDTQYRLVVGDRTSGEIAVVDLLDGESSVVGRAPGVTGLRGDGRYAYAVTPTSTHIVDSGGWTVDHSDHVHYYRAESRAIGAVPVGGRLLDVQADATRTALTYDDTVVVLDRDAQDDGRVEVAHRLPRTGAGAAAVPLAGKLLFPVNGGIEVRESPTATASETVPCRAPSASTVARRGAVFACADSAVVISSRGRVTSLPFPAGVGAIDSLSHRSGANGMVATGPGVRLLLDLTARTATPLPTDLPATNTTSGGTGPVVGAADGTVEVRSDASSPPVRTTLPGVRTTGDLQIDTGRTYVNDPDSDRVFEIDHRDGARVARVIQTPGTASMMVETGR
ncbi:hypothetical protein ACXVUM_09515 [Williamsia sp. SKLECPSW1]